MDFREVIGAYADALFRYSARRLGDRQLAEDAVQETFMRAYRQQQAMPADPGGWLFGIARHCCQEIARARRRPAEAAKPLDDAPAPEPPEPLDAALDGLDAAEQALLHLKHGEGLTGREIAARTGQPLGSVTSALSRAYSKLRDRLAAGRNA